MAGTVTHDIEYGATASMARHVITWVSSSGGAVGPTFDSGSLKRISGVILRVIEQPDTGGTKPSDSYDVLFEDESGTDLLGGQGANVDADATIDVCPGLPFTDGVTTSLVPPALHDVPVLRITNAGNAKGGKLILYVR